jgi:hypothetical protein
MKQRVLVALAVATLAGLVTAPAGEASSTVRPDAFKSVPVTGTILGGGSFQGVLDVQRFAAQGNELVATGVLAGTLTDPLGVTKQVTNRAVTFRVLQIRGTCRILHLVLGPLDLDLLGLRIQLSRVVLDITAHRGPGRLLGNLLCAIAGLLDGPPRLDALANRLNTLVQVAGLVSNIPVTGSTGAGQKFAGTFDVQRFVVRNQRLFASGTLTGVLRDPNGAVVNTVNAAPAVIPIQQIRATCRILRLVLGPLDLDLLGLRIQLNRVVLLITGRTGPGRLLGNLLCAIAGLLDRSAPIGAVANQLNRMVVVRR